MMAAFDFLKAERKDNFDLKTRFGLFLLKVEQASLNTIEIN